MRTEITRADLLRGRFIADEEAFRPPFAIPEREFRLRCDRCEGCREACETGIIGRGGGGFPILRFGQAECTFCGACAKACESGALSLKEARSWAVLAHIKGSCLSLNAVTCRACEESCEAGAIRFRLMTEGRALPLVNEASCTGCGNCAAVCPVHSIDMRSRKTEEVAA